MNPEYTYELRNNVDKKWYTEIEAAGSAEAIAKEFGLFRSRRISDNQKFSREHEARRFFKNTVASEYDPNLPKNLNVRLGDRYHIENHCVVILEGENGNRIEIESHRIQNPTSPSGGGAGGNITGGGVTVGPPPPSGGPAPSSTPPNTGPSGPTQKSGTGAKSLSPTEHPWIWGGAVGAVYVIPYICTGDWLWILRIIRWIFGDQDDT